MRLGLICLISIMMLLFSCRNKAEENLTKNDQYKEFSIPINKIKDLLNDDNLPGISIDSIHFEGDTLITFITDDYHSIVHDLMMDQQISFIFSDFSRLTSAPFNHVGIFYKMPKRDTLGEYFPKMVVSLKDMKSNLIMYSNVKFRTIIDGILSEHKKHSEEDVLETLNFYTNLILSEDKKIEFQFFGFDFRHFLLQYLIECETKNGSYYNRALDRIFIEIEKKNLNKNGMYQRIKKLYEKGCRTKDNSSKPGIII